MRGGKGGARPPEKAFEAERAAAHEQWSKLLNDKLKALNLVLNASDSTIEPHRLLILVDVQGMYLALHEWLTERHVPVEDGLVIGRFALLQIEHAAKTIAERLAKCWPGGAGDLRQLLAALKID